MGSADEKPLQSIPNFFAGKSIFVTGATGFIGRVLLEKLLRSCPQIDTIYILIRPKKGKSIEERIIERTSVALFDRLRKEQPGALNKLHGIQGDVSELHLGMNAEDWKLLQERVSVIFHVAASVRFNDLLAKAVLLNVRGTREVVRLASGMKQLQVLLHVSTTYCIYDEDGAEERIYDAPIDWRTLIELVETQDPFVVRLITNKLIGQYPNTYTFTKAVAEHIINDHRNELPVVIVRPSIVGPTFVEPMPGWIDNFNGLIGLFVSGGKGILRVGYVGDVPLDVIPVDTVCRGVIMASWLEAQKRTASMPVYNSNVTKYEHLTLRCVLEMGPEIMQEMPMRSPFNYPCFVITSNLQIFCLLVAFLHIIPALLIDGVLRLTRRKPMLLRIQRRIFTAFLSLEAFTFTKWTFKNAKFCGLDHFVLPEDCDKFQNKNIDKIDPYQYFKTSAHGGRKYLLNENDDTLPDDLRHYDRIKMLHLFLRNLLYISIIWFVLSRSFAWLYNWIHTL